MHQALAFHELKRAGVSRSPLRWVDEKSNDALSPTSRSTDLHYGQQPLQGHHNASARYVHASASWCEPAQGAVQYGGDGWGEVDVVKRGNEGR